MTDFKGLIDSSFEDFQKVAEGKELTIDSF